MARPRILLPLTYWAWRTVHCHGPITSDDACRLMPGTDLALVRFRLYNLVQYGYVQSSPGAKAYKSKLFTALGTPHQADRLEAMLAQNSIFRGDAIEENGRVSRRPPQKPAAAPVSPPSQPLAVPEVRSDEPHVNRWAATTSAMGGRPLVVRPGSLDARRLASVRFGQAAARVEHDLGVVEAGGHRHA